MLRRVLGCSECLTASAVLALCCCQETACVVCAHCVDTECFARRLRCTSNTLEGRHVMCGMHRCIATWACPKVPACQGGGSDAVLLSTSCDVPSHRCPQVTLCMADSAAASAMCGCPLQVAVHNLCLGVPHGERFGFLGPNGAGKTTT